MLTLDSVHEKAVLELWKQSDAFEMRTQKEVLEKMITRKGWETW